MALIVDHDSTTAGFSYGLYTDLGPAPELQLWSLSAAAPTALNISVTGTLLATLVLPTDWLYLPNDYSFAMLDGPWTGYVDNSGLCELFRLTRSGGSGAKLQGEVTAMAGAGPMKIQTQDLIAGRPLSVTSFTVTMGNL